MGSMRISVRIILNSLTPLMSSGQGRKNTIKTAILLAKQDTRVTAEKTVAILYTMADKFLQGSDRMASLTKKLLEADRMADLQLALDDPGYREKLMKEYGIK